MLKRIILLSLLLIANTTSSGYAKQKNIRTTESIQAGVLKEIHYGILFLSSTNNTSWLKDRNFSPNGAAATFGFLYTLFKILETVQPQSILEFGIGQSSKLTTQYAAYSKNKPSLTVVENDQQWLDLFSQELPQAKNITYLKNDIEMACHKGTKTRRYKDLLNNLQANTFDLIVVDGPKGSPGYSRTNIIDLVSNNRLATKFVILLDDYNREGEQRTAEDVMKILSQRGIPYSTTQIISNKSQLLIVSPEYAFLGSI
jgi:hypothetical protein